MLCLKLWRTTVLKTDIVFISRDFFTTFVMTMGKKPVYSIF